MKAEWFVALAAVIAAAPVALGFIVTRWVKHWSRADRDGPLTHGDCDVCHGTGENWVHQLWPGSACRTCKGSGWLPRV